jgi:two-component system chemotaxis response regulator CheB
MRALVVDDSKPVRSIVTRVLRELNFECTEAANGAEALEVLAAGDRPDLVTVNWHMPVMDGIELLRSVRAQPRYRGCKLVMISTEQDRERVALAMAAGADGYVSKPFTAAALTRQLADLGLGGTTVTSTRRPVRVLLVDDSATIRSLLSRILGSEQGIEVAGTAENGRLGVEAVKQLRPDLVVLDVEMPLMDGISALREIRREHPRLPVIMFSSLTEKGARATLDALLAGANDYVTKPTGGPDEVATRIRGDLVQRIKALAGKPGRPGADQTAPPATRPATRPRQLTTPAGVVIGVSTGGPTALAEVLPHFAPTSPVPILIVQHMPAFFTAQLAERLTRLIGTQVREAADGQILQPGDVLLAPGGRHMELVREGPQALIRLTDDAPENSCRPAADVLFRTAATVWGSGTLGVVLTGMGRDGLAGSRAIVAAGGRILAQDEFTSVVWGMPGEVAKAGLADAVLPLPQLAAEIGLRLRRRGTS